MTPFVHFCTLLLPRNKNNLFLWQYNPHNSTNAQHMPHVPLTSWICIVPSHLDKNSNHKYRRFVSPTSWQYNPTPSAPSAAWEVLFTVVLAQSKWIKKRVASLMNYLYVRKKLCLSPCWPIRFVFICRVLSAAVPTSHSSMCLPWRPPETCFVRYLILPGRGHHLCSPSKSLNYINALVQ